MSFPIPMIRWKNTTVSGVTSLGQNDINFISDTSSLEVGMILDDPEFPAETTIIQVDPNQIFLSENAIASSSGNRSFYFEFKFRYPSSVDDGETVKPKRRVRTSISGIDQVQIDHIRFERDLEFGHLTQAEVDELKNSFYLNHAVFGRSFQYYPDQNDLNEFFVYELDDEDFEPERVGNSDKFNLKTAFKRVES